MIAPNSRARKRGRRGGSMDEYEGRRKGMLATADCSIRHEQKGLGMRGFRMVAAFGTAIGSLQPKL